MERIALSRHCSKMLINKPRTTACVCLFLQSTAAAAVRHHRRMTMPLSLCRRSSLCGRRAESDRNNKDLVSILVLLARPVITHIANVIERPVTETMVFRSLVVETLSVSRSLAPSESLFDCLGDPRARALYRPVTDHGRTSGLVTLIPGDKKISEQRLSTSFGLRKGTRDTTPQNNMFYKRLTVVLFRVLGHTEPASRLVTPILYSGPS